VIALWGAQAAPADEQVVAEAPGAAGLTAFGGHVVWSAPDLATGRWKLVQWNLGVLTALPVPERTVPFDADAGSDAHGRPVALFSRCRTDPTQSFGPPDWALAKGCDIWQIRLDGGPAHLVRSVSSQRGAETTPSMWHGAIVFQRRLPGHAVSKLLLLSRHATAPRSLPVGAVFDRAQDPRLPGDAVSALDLGPRAVAFVWLANADTGQAPLAWQLWVDTLQPVGRIGVDSGGEGECAGREPVSPNAHLAFEPSSIMFVRASSFCPDVLNPAGEQSSTIIKFDWARRTALQARTSTPFALEAAADARATWWLRGTAVALSSEGANPVTCSASGTPCQLMHSEGFIFDNINLAPPVIP
jgi:hypothetical protein